MVTPDREFSKWRMIVGHTVLGAAHPLLDPKSTTEIKRKFKEWQFQQTKTRDEGLIRFQKVC